MCLVCCRLCCTPWFLSPGLKYALLHRLCRFCCARRAPALGNFLAPDEHHSLQQDLSEAWAATLWGLSALLSGVLCLMDQPTSPVRCLSPVWRSTLQNAACHPDLLAQSEATSADLTAQSPKAFGKKGSGLHVSSPCVSRPCSLLCFWGAGCSDQLCLLGAMAGWWEWRRGAVRMDPGKDLVECQLPTYLLLVLDKPP